MLIGPTEGGIFVVTSFLEDNVQLFLKLVRTMLFKIGFDLTEATRQADMIGIEGLLFRRNAQFVDHNAKSFEVGFSHQIG